MAANHKGDSQQLGVLLYLKKTVYNVNRVINKQKEKFVSWISTEYSTSEGNFNSTINLEFNSGFHCTPLVKIVYLAPYIVRYPLVYWNSLSNSVT